MCQELENLSKSRQIAARTIYEAFKVLQENGGQLLGKTVVDSIKERLVFNDWEKDTYKKTGNVRWESVLQFYTIDCIKAGFLRKNKGVWYLTEEGEKSIDLGPVKLLETVTKLYREWVEKNREIKNRIEIDEVSDLEENITHFQKANLDTLEDQAIAGIKDFIFQKNPYEFQDLVAALLRSMSYHTPFISPKGRDGGLDIVAYRDPLGASEPRIKVQVKHKPQSTIPVDDIRSLVGLLNRSGDIGLFVTSGSFSSDSLRFARDSHIHVRLIDINDFIQLWQEFYHKLTDEEKNLLPLHQISFLGTNE